MKEFYVGEQIMYVADDSSTTCAIYVGHVTGKFKNPNIYNTTDPFLYTVDIKEYPFVIGYVELDSMFHLNELDAATVRRDAIILKKKLERLNKVTQQIAELQKEQLELARVIERINRVNVLKTIIDDVSRTIFDETFKIA